MWAVLANSNLFFLNLNNLFRAKAQASADALLIPKPYPNGSGDFMETLTGVCASESTTFPTVGKLIAASLKIISLTDDFSASTITSLSIVQPTPTDPIFVRFLLGRLEKIKETLAGQEALALFIPLSRK